MLKGYKKISAYFGCKLLTVIIFILVLVACDLFKTEKQEEIPEYKSNKLWEKALRSDLLEMPLQVDNSIYGFEFADGNESGEKKIFFKLDLNNGEYIWQTEEVETTSTEFPFIFENKVFVYLKKGILWILDDATGKKLATIKLMFKNDEKMACISYPAFLITSDGKYLVYSWAEQNLINDDGIMRLSLSDIDYTKDPEEEQVLYPDLIWHGDKVDPEWKEDEYISAMMIEENGIVYFETIAQFSDGNHTRLGAIEVESGKLKWGEMKNLHKRFCGGIKASLYLLDDNLYVFEKAVACYNKETGKTVWERIQSEKDLLNEPWIGGLVLNKAGVFYDEGCFYYTTTDSYMDPLMTNRKIENIGNVKCLDASTGKLKWQYLTGNCGFTSSRPIVTEEKVFVIVPDIGLWVLDKKTGKLIGVDSSVCNLGDDRNYLWNGNVYYFNNDYDRQERILTCIKP